MLYLLNPRLMLPLLTNMHNLPKTIYTKLSTSNYSPLDKNCHNTIQCYVDLYQLTLLTNAILPDLSSTDGPVRTGIVR